MPSNSCIQEVGGRAGLSGRCRRELTQMQKETPGDRAMENVILAVLAGLLRRYNTFLPFPHLLPMLFVHVSNFTHSDRITLRAMEVVISWPLLLYRYRLWGRI